MDDSGNGEIEYEEFEKMLKGKQQLKLVWFATTINFFNMLILMYKIELMH